MIFFFDKSIYLSILVPLSFILSLLFIEGSLFLEITEGNTVTNLDRMKSNDSAIRLFGIEGENLTTINSIDRGLHNTSGFLVTHVFEESPAHNAGIMKDDIILELNNTFIKSKSDFVSSLKNIHNGDRVNVMIIDNLGEIINLEVHLVWDNENQFYESSHSFKNPESVNFSSFNDLDFTIEYPSSWNTSRIDPPSRDLATRSVKFTSLSENNTDIREYVKVYVLHALNQSLEQVLEIKVPNNEYQIIERNNVSMLDNHSASSVSFRFVDYTHGEIKAIKIATIHNSKIYLITYHAKAENFDIYWPTVQEMIQSFRINDVDTYENFNMGLSIKYPKNILNYRNDCANFDNDNCLEFIPYDLNENLTITASKTIVKDKPMNTLIRESTNLKDDTLVNFSLINSLNSSITNNDDPAELLYTYYDPHKGNSKGEEILRRIDDKLYSFKYETNEHSFSKHRSLFGTILNSIEFPNIISYYDYELGISMRYPSTWQTDTVGEDSLKISQADNNEINFVVNMSMAHMVNNLTTENLLQCPATNNGNDGLLLTALNVEMSAENNCATVRNIVESIRSIDNDYTLSQQPLKSYNGQIDHPFEIEYISDWESMDMNDISRGISFYPDPSYPTVFTITYWNEKENGKTLDDSKFDDFVSLNENFREVVQVSHQSKDDSIPSSIKNNRSSFTYTFKDQYDSQYTYWIFYGTDDYKRNYKIEYFSLYDDFLKYWPGVMNMIKTMEVHDKEIYGELPHGIPAGEGPLGAVLDDDRNLLYVVNSISSTISIINSTSNKEIEKVEVRTNPPPFGVAINKDTDTLYVTHHDPLFFGNSSFITIIKNVSSTKIVTSKTIIGNPFEVAVDSITGKIYIGDRDNHKVTVLNGTHDEISRINITNGMEGRASSGFGLAIDERSKTIYAVEELSGNLTLIDGDKDNITESIEIHSNGDSNHGEACMIDVAVDSVISRAYVVNSINCQNTDGEDHKGELLVIDTKSGKKIEDVGIGTAPSNVVVNPQTHRIYVTNNLDDSITIIEPLTHDTTELKVGAGPIDIAINPKTSTAYITNGPTNSINIIDENSKKIVQSIKFNVFPSNAGVITCNNIDYNANSSISLIFNKGICEARPKTGFSFESWYGNVKDLSVDISEQGPILMRPFNDILRYLSLSNDPGRLEIRSSGDLQANFRSAPEPISREYLTGLVGIAIAIFTGYLAPNAVQWINSFRQRKHMVNHYNQLQNLSKDKLINYKKLILLDYGNGRINEKQYEILIEQISNLEKQFEVK